MKTKYGIVKDYIKSKILDGTYQPNQKISSESELMKQFGVSRHTVRQAIGELVNKGWLYREQGAGTFCADRSLQEDSSRVILSKNIAIITTYISDYIFPSIIRGAESYLSQHGYQVSLFSTNNDYEKEKGFLETILTQNFQGAIIEPTKSAYSNPNINYYLNLERLNIPYVMINAYYDELDPLSVTLDDEQGGFMQTEHLINLGHHNIVGFFKSDDLQGIKRMKGYLKAHRKNKLIIQPKNIITYSTIEKESRPSEELKKILTHPDGEKPTAIVCYNDELAINLLNVLREFNLRVPEDISLIGYDNSFLSNVSEVKLTTIEHPLSKMGKTAAKMILDLVEKKTNSKNKEKDIDSIMFEPRLVLRNSTKEINE